MSQKEAVYQATIEILRQANIEMSGRPAKDAVPKEIRKLVTLKMLEYAEQGLISFEDKESNKKRLADRAKLTAYLSGLISNHWKRDARLNGSGR